ncbi:hypothetical protein [Tychonema sp. LEGE 07203]|uniref:hypothetical protein n=1 Tax=Tychonema sp. LEGE 07203 TaxID=1828671 RepID=UPI001D13939A|nr:hypothetical protein [Tychonema sp. LEGE 07203]
MSVGILGLLAAIALWGYYVCLALNSSMRGIEAVVIAYLIFTVTWFDCAQYAHIAWWILSLAAVKSASFTRFYRFRSQSGQWVITN